MTSFSHAISTLISTLVFILNSFVCYRITVKGRRDRQIRSTELCFYVQASELQVELPLKLSFYLGLS